MNRPSTPRARGGVLGLGLLAAVVRWGALGGTRGLLGYHGYDDGVYFTAALALVHGRVPYRDYLLLHPPGGVLALVPFAACAHLLGDAHALALARLALIAVGVANTVMVAAVARRWGLAPAVVAGVLYALHPAAAGTETLTLLEPWGTAALLGGVLLLRRAQRPGAARAWWWVAGAALGLAVPVKLWGVVPVLVVVACVLAHRGAAPAAGAAGGALLSAATVVAPFAAMAGSSMWRMVVLDQLGRPRASAPLTRWPAALGLPGDQPTWQAWLAAVVLTVLLASAGTAAWRADRGRAWVVLAAVQLLVLLVSPSFYPHYAAFAAPACAIVVAAGVSTLPPRMLAPAPRLAFVTGAVLGITLALVGSLGGPRFPAASIAARLPADGCIASDSPGALALLGVLSRDLARGCALPVDLSGYSYDVGARDGDGHPVPRSRNLSWQGFAFGYLTSASATVLVRPVGNGFDAATAAALDDLVVTRIGAGARLLVP